MVTGDYGFLTDVARNAGMAVLAAGSIAASWKRRSRWEPAEEDIPAGPQKFAGLVSAVIIVLLWGVAGPESRALLIRLSLQLLGISVASMLVYGFLVAANTYSLGEDETRATIIGGFWLTREAREARKSGIRLQNFLDKMGHVDAVWPRPSRALSKQVFVLTYIGMVSCGTIALASACLQIGSGNTDGPKTVAEKEFFRLAAEIDSLSEDFKNGMSSNDNDKLAKVDADMPNLARQMERLARQGEDLLAPEHRVSAYKYATWAYGACAEIAVSRAKKVEHAQEALEASSSGLDLILKLEDLAESGDKEAQRALSAEKSLIKEDRDILLYTRACARVIVARHGDVTSTEPLPEEVSDDILKDLKGVSSSYLRENPHGEDSVLKYLPKELLAGL